MYVFIRMFLYAMFSDARFFTFVFNEGLYVHVFIFVHARIFPVQWVHYKEYCDAAGSAKMVRKMTHDIRHTKRKKIPHHKAKVPRLTRMAEELELIALHLAEELHSKRKNKQLQLE